ncbi:hypothetical protein V1511DRAFT_491412 [Dipodascopsis uninucleata]
MIFEQTTAEMESNLRRRKHDDMLVDNTEIIDVRAYQRTYEGAYLRTAMLEVTLSLSIIRVFDIEFYPIGAAFAVIGFAFMAIGLLRRLQTNRFHLKIKPQRYVLTAGNMVLGMTIVCVLAYIAMFVEVFRLQ